MARPRRGPYVGRHAPPLRCHGGDKVWDSKTKSRAPGNCVQSLSTLRESIVLRVQAFTRMMSSHPKRQVQVLPGGLAAGPRPHPGEHGQSRQIGGPPRAIPSLWIVVWGVAWKAKTPHRKRATRRDRRARSRSRGRLRGAEKGARTTRGHGRRRGSACLGMLSGLLRIGEAANPGPQAGMVPVRDPRRGVGPSKGSPSSTSGLTAST